ncbi:Tol-Pal system beta propeller repeat protein TolB [Thioalkalivibrio sp. HK1]|uniref:Tol-Pal system beta propeller repeat protein TolB n=1 Tax=Thioalkalivibrio sp. HK1 TaxID=1469245 RepID=UPI00046EF06A|nr:Tol-Pal system beta propeller repeat protein TolB [Thioalkalivibrio sp. HK1]
MPIASIRVLALLSLSVALGFASGAEAVITFKITRSSDASQPIAVIPFAWQAERGDSPNADMASIISSDLAGTGLFDPLPFEDLPSRPTRHDEIEFGDWRLLAARYLVIGSITSGADGLYVVEFRLYDVPLQDQLTALRITYPASETRRVAHQIADEIYYEITGVRGAFDTRIAYITEQKSDDDSSTYILNIADIDGHAPRAVLESDSPIMSPSWSPDGSHLAYVSFESNRPAIYVQEVSTGLRESYVSFSGINSAPAFSPDGESLAIVLSKDGNPEIYVMDLKSKDIRRLTRNSAIDTEPSWSPDGRHLVFTSDRGGRPQIYRISSQGGRAERITFQGSYNARAVYSPDGKKLAIVHRDGSSRFRIALLDLRTRYLQILTDSRLDESPSFAPNGSMILYATTTVGGQSALAAVSADGSVRQQLADQPDRVREPAWSPYRD